MGATAREPNFQTPGGSSLGPFPVSGTDAEAEIAKPVINNFSIFVGGPVYDFLLRIGLIRLGLPNVMRRIAALIVITWLPLLILSLLDGLAYGQRVAIPFLTDFSMYGRLWLTLPLLLLAEVVIDPAIRSTAQEFVDAGVIQKPEYTEFERVLASVQRLRDSWLPETALLAVAFVPVFLFQHEWGTGAVSSWHSGVHGLTRAGWWYAVISAPMVRFILYRWAFRYFIWALLLWKVSRLRLNLIPTHPDRTGGLGFLSLTQARFGIIFCATGFAFAGRVLNSVVHEGATLASFKFLMAGYVALSLIAGLFPLLLLGPKLARVRRKGLREYGRLGNQYTEAFDRKWVHHAQPAEEPLLGTADIQSLADLGNSYAVIEEMNISPITKKLTIQLVVLAALPLVPVILIATPTAELVNAILKMVA
jgi:hypothetical protein